MEMKWPLIRFASLAVLAEEEAKLRDEGLAGRLQFLSGHLR